MRGKGCFEVFLRRMVRQISNVDFQLVLLKSPRAKQRHHHPYRTGLTSLWPKGNAQSKANENRPSRSRDNIPRLVGFVKRSVYAPLSLRRGGNGMPVVRLQISSRNRSARPRRNARAQTHGTPRFRVGVHPHDRSVPHPWGEEGSLPVQLLRTPQVSRSGPGPRTPNRRRSGPA